MSSYNTRQKSAVAAFFSDHPDRGFTPEEVASSVPDVPRSTVYRLISQLCDDGAIRRTGPSGRWSVYKHQGASWASHMHIRCRSCGRTEHLDAATTREIESLVYASSGYLALDTTVFEGLCSSCRKAER